MPPDVHAALDAATDAAAHLRAQIADLAHAVETNDTEAIVTAARSLVSNSDRTALSQDSPDRPEHGSDQGESP